MNILGFKLDWGSGGFGSVTRGKASLMLCEGSQGHSGTWMWFAVSDADRLFEELRDRGARIRHPPENFPWGSRELHVFDVRGVIVRAAPAPGVVFRERQVGVKFVLEVAITAPG